jgi:hypothetical protein
MHIERPGFGEIFALPEISDLGSVYAPFSLR